MYVQDNIKENDYYRTTTGEIFKAVASKNGRVYYAFGEHYWVDSIAITNFQEDLIDLIEDTDILQVEISEEWVMKEDTIRFIIAGQTTKIKEIKEALEDGIYKIKKILTHEQFSSIEYKVEED